MLSWWMLAALGIGVALGGIMALIFLRRSSGKEARYVTIPPDTEPIDPLARSQLKASLIEEPRRPGDMLDNLRAWALGTTEVMSDLEDLRRQLRTLHIYVLDLDGRYLRREDAAWQSLQVSALVLGIATGTSMAVWAVIELVGR